jgi:4a-hydroxytetrahydrobiopterin dehydratase
MLTLGIIQERLKKLNGWGLERDFIVKDYTFGNFREAIAFVNKVAELAEKRNHHPDIVISYNKLRLSLTTHAEHGITSKDFELAEEIDKIV